MNIGQKTVHVYDPALLSVRADNQYLTGYSDSGKYTAEMNEDNTLPHVGVDGEVSYAINNDRTGTLTVTFASTSPSLPYIRTLAREKRDFNVTVVDMNENGMNISSDNCRIIKEPEYKRGKEVEEVEVEIFVPYMY